MNRKRRLISSLMILSIVLTACQTTPAPISTPKSTPAPTPVSPKYSPGTDVTLPAEELDKEINDSYQAGAALGAQAVEAELRPQLEAWREAAKWIAAGGISLAAASALFAFIQGFTLGSK